MPTTPPSSPRPRIEVVRADDVQRYVETDNVVWFEEAGSRPYVEQASGVPEDQRFAVDLEDTDPRSYSGIYGVRPLELTVPGAEDGQLTRVPCAGLTWVGVHPDQRRRGVLTAMLRDHFVRTRDEGVWLSALHASEPSIYGRHGYGEVSRELDVALPSGATLTAPHLEKDVARVTTRMENMTEDGVAERLRAVQERSGADDLGSVLLSTDFYRAVCAEPPESRRGHEVRRVLFAQVRGHDTGAVMLRREQKWDRGRPGGTITAERVVGDPASRLALLRRLVAFDLIGKVVLHAVADDDPLWHWIGGVRAAGEVSPIDSLWIRLVDLPRALAARGYAADCDVVIDVADESAPWNRGKWRVTVDGGRAEATKVRTRADLVMSAQHLGAIYLGTTNLLTLVAAGVVEERRPGAALELWRALRADRTPVAAAGF